ncbi:recombinase family protein [Streptomyces sp. NBC_00249]|nr:recombinase family protein [Streptomyces sp. NBC_00249]
MDTQLDAFAEAGITRVFPEKISTRVKDRPELGKAIALACELRASGVRVTLVIHEHKRLGRRHDLVTLAVRLREHDVELEFLTGELQGSHDPHGRCSRCWPRCPAWSASTSGRRRWTARSPPAGGARRSAARRCPTPRCSPWPCTCGTPRS